MPTKPQDPQQTPLDATPVAVRVLTACNYGQANDVVEIPANEVDAAKSNGLVDDHPDAVAYARSLQGE